jgi:hypothetical protein
MTGPHVVMSDDNNDIIGGFELLLNRCVGVQENDELLVIYDESLGDLHRPLLDVIEAGSMSATFACIPKSYQDCLVRAGTAGTIRDKIPLPHGLIAAISNSTVILNLLSGDPATASLRRTINHTNRMKLCRLATIPGINADIVRLLKRSPIDQIYESCEITAWALGECSTIDIRSYDGSGGSYDLRIGFAGWDNEPIMSPGVLLPGSWGNVPPGETFCCPNGEQVNGNICISGSIPGHVIDPGGEVILTFASGRLISWQAVDPHRVNPDALNFFERAKVNAELNSDPNWNVFAEFGLGLNPRISSLTGNPLFDEKASDSIHIAIGDNSGFGHDTVSFHHSDLVVWRPDVKLDGELFLDRGHLGRERLVRRRMEPPRADALSLDAIIRLREARCEYVDGMLLRRLTKAHRVNFISVGGEAISRALAGLCETLASRDAVLVRQVVREAPMRDGFDTMDLLGILNHYKVLHVRPPTGAVGAPELT